MHIVPNGCGCDPAMIPAVSLRPGVPWGKAWKM